MALADGKMDDKQQPGGDSPVPHDIDSAAKQVQEALLKKQADKKEQKKNEAKEAAVQHRTLNNSCETFQKPNFR